MTQSPQAEVISFLSSVAAYTCSPLSVERHETHGAIVFLTGDRAYKLKRAVQLPYMDYSTVALRRQMCLRELEVNRGMAPEIYIGVAKVQRRADGTLFIATDGGDADAVDWLVVMHRFPQGSLLEEMRRDGTLSDDILCRAARRIADFHANSEVHRDFGGAEGMSSVVEGNQAVLGDTFTGFWLEAPQRVLESRIAARTNDASDATIEVLHRQLENISPAEDWIKIEAEAGPEDVFLRAVRHLQQGGSQ